MKRKVSIFEIVWYSLTGGVGLWGLVYIVLGTVARYLDLKSGVVKADNVIKSTFGLGFFWWGILLMLIGLALAMLILLITAYNNNNKVEKTSKHAARLAELDENK